MGVTLHMIDAMTFVFHFCSKFCVIFCWKFSAFFGDNFCIHYTVQLFQDILVYYSPEICQMHMCPYRII